jgi:TPR repeat protein
VKKIFLFVLVLMIPAFVLALPPMKYVRRHGIINVDILYRLQQEAKSGNASSAANLGIKYVGGTIGILPNYQEGLYWLRKAADRGAPLAYYVLAKFYLEGRPGLPANKRLARKYAKLAFNGFRRNLAAKKYDRIVISIIRYNLGDLYFWGFPGVIKQDLAKAFELTKLAANGGDEHAMRRLAMMYRYGVGTERDLIEAHKWSLFLAQLGLVEAQYTVGLDFLEGVGTAVDRDQGMKWLSQAAGADYYPAMIKLVDLSKQGKIASISDTRRLGWQAIVGNMIGRAPMAVAK